MREIAQVIAGFGLDFYIETYLTKDESEKANKEIDKDVDSVISKISDYVELNADKEFLNYMEEFYDNQFIDYLAHFKLMNGEVVSIDEEIKNFIICCNDICKDCVKEIINNILYN